MSDRPLGDTEEGYRWLESFTNLETIQASRNRQLYRLDRMTYLLGLFGDPHRALPSVHVAGSKGKGSTAALIAAALSSDRRVGLYTSPHVSSYDERITVAGLPADPGVMLRTMNTVRDLVRSLSPATLPVSPTPTTFELLTLIAFLVFRETRCDWAVLEVGIGGRLDATNVVTPQVSVITPLELEHTEILGATLEEIATEKAGIIKPGVPVVCAAQRPEARRVLDAIARERSSPITFADDVVDTRLVDVHRDGTRVSALVEGETVELSLAMPGVFQADNALLAWLALRRLPVRPPPEAIRAAFGRTSLPGRMERLRTAGGRTVVLDGAHTPQSVRRAADSFLRMYPRGGALLFGSILGKRTQEMADVLGPLFDHVVVSRPNSFKESNPREVVEAFLRVHPRCRLVVDPAAALEAACADAGEDRPVFVTGSFYMISEIRRLLRTNGRPSTEDSPAVKGSP